LEALEALETLPIRPPSRDRIGDADWAMPKEDDFVRV
jgi:hypothetical protein